jgi:hypothetical protein
MEELNGLKQPAPEAHTYHLPHLLPPYLVTLFNST